MKSPIRNGLKTRTKAQIEASRKNGAKSHGPATPEGKAISARNSLRHGCTAKNVLLPSEAPASFHQMSETYYAKFQPADDVERDFVDEMVLAKWRLRRDWSNEANLISVQMSRQKDEALKEFPNLTPAVEYALAFGTLSDKSKSLANASRYEASHRRSFYGALTGLLNLRAAVPPADDENCETNPSPTDLPSDQSPEPPAETTEPPTPSAPTPTTKPPHPTPPPPSDTNTPSETEKPADDTEPPEI